MFLFLLPSMHSRSIVKYGRITCFRCHSIGHWLCHNSLISNAKISGKCSSITSSHCCCCHWAGFVICIVSVRWCWWFTIVPISFWKRPKSPNMQTIRNCAMESSQYSQSSGLSHAWDAIRVSFTVHRSRHRALYPCSPPTISSTVCSWCCYACMSHGPIWSWRLLTIHWNRAK